MRIEQMKKYVDKIYSFMDKNPSTAPILLLIGVILVTEGLIYFYTTLQGWFSHITMEIIILMIVIGVADILFISLYIKRNYRKGEEKDIDMAPYLKKIDRYLRISNPYISVILGALIVFVAWYHNVLGYGATTKIGDADLILIILGISFIFYPFVPPKFHIERDFILSFFIFLVIILAIMPFLFFLFGEAFIYYFLTLPVHWLLNVIGVPNRVITANRIGFKYNGYSKVIEIARACSGIYSFSIFTSAFIAFVLVVYRKLDIKAWLFLILGISLAYIGNVIRMTIVVASGHYYGPETMLWVHENIGYVIFFTWMAFFWFLLYHFLMREKTKN